MTTNAYVFAWDCTGIEAIVPISQYEDWETTNAFRTLEGRPPKPNPMAQTINMLKLRAQYNPQRYYEIYALDCDSSFTPSVWSKLWHDDPQQCALMVRARGVHIWGEPMPVDRVKIR